MDEVDENDEGFLCQGYAIAFADGINLNLALSCQLTLQQNFQLTITRQIEANEFDASGIATTVKDLLGDLKLVIDEIEKDPTVGSASLTGGAYISHLQPEKIFPDRNDFWKVEALFGVQFLEQLT